jgi:hypothetical protein
MAKAAHTSIISKSHPHVPLFTFFVFLASLREKLLAGTITRAAYSAALVDAAAAETDDNWRELEAWHKAQRARRAGRSR